MKRKRIYAHKHFKDEMLDITICRNCGRIVEYGKLINYAGHDACPVCYESMREHITEVREHDYGTYRDADHLYLLSDREYLDICEKVLQGRHRFVSRQESRVRGMREDLKKEKGGE